MGSAVTRDGLGPEYDDPAPDVAVAEVEFCVYSPAVNVMGMNYLTWSHVKLEHVYIFLRYNALVAQNT